MKQITAHQEILEFTYDTEEERTKHIEEMALHGWKNGARVKRLKPNVPLWNCSEDDFEWFARFWKCHTSE